MTKHIILWTLKDEFDDVQKNEIRKNAKTALENLAGKIDGLKNIELEINPLPSSNADMILITEFNNIDSLKGYQINPLHVSAADTFVRPFTKTRLCFDYNE